MVNAGPLWQASATLATGFLSSPVKKSEVMPMMTPVSYTHLDVYKRQMLRIAEGEPVQKNG